MELEVTQVAAITGLCYLAGAAGKALGLEGKWIPVLCGALGAALGCGALFWMPGFPASDVLSAMAVGGISGLAATGADQVMKKLQE